MARPSSRERILDALEQVVIRDGVASATLDAVCAEAGVSKGGLLYHFPSRDELFAGLHERLFASIDAEVAEAPTGRDELVAWYLRHPAIDDTESGLYVAFIASVRADANDVVVADRLAELFDRFYVPLRTLDDAALVAHVEMVSDGMFLRAILGLDIPGAAARQAMVDRILDRP
jgi:AcrR family transcriptional regulator